jgi:hypothetical protein
VSSKGTGRSAGYIRWDVRDFIADYQLIRAWGGAGRRHLARPPERLGLQGSVLVEELAVDAEGWQGVCDHLARLAGVAGDGLLRLIEVGPDLDTGTVFVVTEEAEPPLPAVGAQQAASRVLRAARALHAMHEVGLTYGPLRTASILDAGGRIVVDLPTLDGEPGRILEQADWETLQMIEPEVLSGETPTRSSDIWALGALLHCVLSRSPLYPGIEEEEAVSAVQRVLFTRPTIDSAIDGRYLPLIEACLQPDPADRPASAATVADQLEGASRR